MSFDFYFAGTQSPQTTSLLINLNANILRSYANDMRSIKQLMELKKTGEYKGKLFIDSGAFSVHRNGKTLDVDKYIEWLNENSQHLDYFVQVDHIPGNFGEERKFEDIIESTEKSWENYLYMIERLKEPQKLIPVFHAPEPYSHLERIVNHKIGDSYVPYICLSYPKDGSYDKLKWQWIKNCFSVIKESNNPNVKVHCLGCAIKQLLEMYPFTSSDATSWLQTSANGGIMTDYGNILMSDRKQSDATNFENLPQAAKDKIKQLATERGVDIEELKSNYKARSDFNVVHLHTWAQNYEYKGGSVFKKGGLF